MKIFFANLEDLILFVIEYKEVCQILTEMNGFVMSPYLCLWIYLLPQQNEELLVFYIKREIIKCVLEIYTSHF